MLDFMSDETRRNPFPLYDQIRAQAPLLRNAQSDAWMVFDYAGVKRVLTDHESFSSSVTPAPVISKWLIFSDQPRHAKLRGLISRAFTPAVVANLEPRIRELSGGLLNAVIDRGEMDLAQDLTEPLPMMVIAEMLGVATTDWLRFKQWGDAVLKLSYAAGASPEALQSVAGEYAAAMMEMRSYFTSVLENRRRAPADDLLTKLAQAEVDGDRLSDDEILGFFQLLLVAGTETTTNLLNNAVLCFLENPEGLETLRQAPGLLPSAIEEVLRYRSPVQWMFRMTRRDVELHGQMIPAGKLVLPVIGSANRDPQQFPEPRRFNMAREPNPHIAFGHGIHFCLGAPLSRLEARVALADLLARAINIRAQSDQPWEPRKALHIHGPAHLPIRFDPAERAAMA